MVISHYPYVTSKWNRIEQRLFSFITKNWRVKPPVTHKVMVNVIGATMTTTGLTVACQLDPKEYEKGQTLSQNLSKFGSFRISYMGSGIIKLCRIPLKMTSFFCDNSLVEMISK